MNVSHRAEIECSICEKFATKVTFQSHKRIKIIMIII